jgi:Universal stress protein family
MLPVNTILHPTDFSERSQYAFWLACSLARDYGARLIVLHVIAAPAVVYAEGIVPPNPEELRAAAQKEFDRLQAPRGGPASRAAASGRGRRRGDPACGRGSQCGSDRDGHARADWAGETSDGERGRAGRPPGPHALCSP